jgi:hypothetical protein
VPSTIQNVKQEGTDIQDIAVFYQNKIDRCKQEDRKHKEETAKQLEAVKELRGVYLFGLQKVSKLQDLREAPDAILPGNFVVQGDASPTIEKQE